MIRFNKPALSGCTGITPEIASNQQQVGEDFYYTCPEPLGGCAGIGEWNDPLQIACWKAAPSLCFFVCAKPAFPFGDTSFICCTGFD